MVIISAVLRRKITTGQLDKGGEQDDMGMLPAK